MAITLAMLPLWVLNRRKYPGIGLWVIDFAFQSLGNALILFRGAIPDFASIVIGNTLYPAGNFLLLVGLERFYGQRSRYLVNGMLLAVHVAFFFYFGLIAPNQSMRGGVLAVIIGVQMAQIVYLLNRRILPDFRRMARPLTVMCILFIALMSLRVAIAFAEPGNVEFFSFRSQPTALILLGSQIFSVLILISLFYIVNSRLSWELKESLGALRESEDRYRSMAEHSPSGILISDDAGKIVYVNARLTQDVGYPAETLVGHEVLSFVSPDSRELVRQRHRDRRQGREAPGMYEIPLLTAHKGVRIFELNASLFRDAHGSVRSIAQLVDITDRKAVEATLKKYQETLELMVEERTGQLIQAEKLASLGELSAGVAHEISNPNNFIMLNAPLLKKGWESALPLIRTSPDAARARVGDVPLLEFADLAVSLTESIYGGAERIERIVGDLCAYARPSGAGAHAAVDLNNVARAAMHLIEATLRKRTARLELCLSEAPVLVRGDFQKLEQVVINLLRNAADALTDKSQSIRLATRMDETSRQAVIEVRDEGRGIAESDLARITDPFYTTKRGTGGTGLGLSVSLRIVRDHGGTLRYSSKLGEGTTAAVELTAPEDSRGS